MPESISWMVPILPGKLEDWKAFQAELVGNRREEHQRSRQRMGIFREVVSLMETPQGDFVALFHEADDMRNAFHAAATSPEPFDVWCRERLVELHGVTAEMLDGPAPAQVMLDYRDEALVRQLAERAAGQQRATSSTD